MFPFAALLIFEATSGVIQSRIDSRTASEMPLPWLTIVSPKRTGYLFPM